MKLRYVCVWAANRQMNDKFINRRSSNGFVLRDGHTEKNPGGYKLLLLFSIIVFVAV